jgi:hypothetical protein
MKKPAISTYAEMAEITMINLNALNTWLTLGNQNP